MNTKEYITPIEKFCNKCKTTQSINNFSLRKGKYPRSNCKKCECSIVREYWKSNPKIKKDKWNKRKINRLTNIKYKIQDRIADWRSKTPNSDLTTEYLVNIWNQQNGLCYYSGIEMNWKASKPEKYGMSLDRLDPNKGYIKNNVVFCCYIINTMKWNNSEKDFYELMKQILKYKNEI